MEQSAAVQFFTTFSEAHNAIAYVPTEAECAQITAFHEKADWWHKRGDQALWDTDGFSLTAFVAGPAAEDEVKQATRLQAGGFGVFQVLIRLSDMSIACSKPEQLTHRVHDWQTEWKWVVRNEHGRMQKDDDDRWMIYPYKPKRASTLEKRGYAERYAVLPYQLVSRRETIGAAMKRGIGASQLDRYPQLTLAA